MSLKSKVNLTLAIPGVVRIKLTKILKQATMELEKEDFRNEVDLEKKRIIIRRERSFWRKLFPFKIKIVRIKNV